MNLISCGKENIRLWKLKNKHIAGSSIVLNEHARDTIFNDFVVFDYNSTFNQEGDVQEDENEKRVHFEEKDYKIIFTSNRGIVYLVDFKGA